MRGDANCRGAMQVEEKVDEDSGATWKRMNSVGTVGSMGLSENWNYEVWCLKQSLENICVEVAMKLQKQLK